MLCDQHCSETGDSAENVCGGRCIQGGKGPNDRGLSRKHIIEGTKAKPFPFLFTSGC